SFGVVMPGEREVRDAGLAAVGAAGLHPGALGDSAEPQVALAGAHRAGRGGGGDDGEGAVGGHESARSRRQSWAATERDGQGSRTSTFTRPLSICCTIPGRPPMVTAVSSSYEV